jgi:hypothetical protein
MPPHEQAVPVIVIEEIMWERLQVIRQTESGQGTGELTVYVRKEVAQTALDEPLEQPLRFGRAVRWLIGQIENA